MTVHLMCFVLLLSPVLSRIVPNFDDLEEDEHHLYRAAYETPAYNQDEYQEPYQEDLPLGKLDLVKDGLWAVKAKLKELKAFDKAMAANLLSTRLKVKELLKNHLGELKKHQHVEYHKPSYGYQAPSYQAPHYSPAPQYGSEPQYGTPAGQYVAPAAPAYAAPTAPAYAAPTAPQYAAPAPAYAAPTPQYATQILQYGGHDPYYGH